MKFLRKLFLFTCIGLLGWGAVYTYNQLTDGFSVYQMTSSLPPYPEFEVPLDNKETLRGALDQPFRYIGKGCQFYAFESADGRYVLKFLKHKHLRPFTWLNKIPLPPKLREMANIKIYKRKKRVENLFSSCKLAYETLDHETGLLYIHLNRSPALDMEVMLTDKLGLRHRISLDDHEFVVQKKALPVKEVFEQIASEEELALRIEQLIAVVIARCEKGIADRDRSFVQNVAFCAHEPRALFIDTGQFYEDEQMRTLEAQEKDLKKRLGNLRHWTEKHFPTFVPVVESYLP